MRSYPQRAALFGPFIYSMYVLFLATLIATLVSLFKPHNVQRAASAISQSYTESLRFWVQPETSSAQGEVGAGPQRRAD